MPDKTVKERVKRYQRKLAAVGLCRRGCGKPCPGGGAYCEEHQGRRKPGYTPRQCPRCGQPGHYRKTCRASEAQVAAYQAMALAALGSAPAAPVAQRGALG